MKKITLNSNGTLKHLWINGLHQIPDEAIEVSDSIFIELSQNSNRKYDPNTGETSDYLKPFSFEDGFAQKNNEIRQAFSQSMQPITAGYTAEEIASFPTQESEAKAYSVDTNADTPTLDFMVANRPSVDKPTLVSRILANSVIYKQVAGPAIGKKQHFEDLLYALKVQHDDPQQPDVTQADFDAIVVDFS